MENWYALKKHEDTGTVKILTIHYSGYANLIHIHIYNTCIHM